MFFFQIPAPDEALLISGGKRGKGSEDPFRVVTGHGTFVVPPFRKGRKLTLAEKKSDVSEPCFTNEKFKVQVNAVIVFHVPGTDTKSIVAAGQRFVREEDEMVKVTAEIFAGHLRTIVGTLTLDQLVTDREKFETAVLSSSKAEMSNLGLQVDSLKIKTLDDLGSGALAALNAPHLAAIRKEANVAAARAEQASVEAQQTSAQAQAQATRDTALKNAGFQAEVQAAQAESAQAGPLADAKKRREVLEMESELAQRQAALKELQLVTEVQKPAEAQATQVRIAAEAQAKQTEIAAQAEANQQKYRAQGNAESTKLNAAANAEATRLEGRAEADRKEAVGTAEAKALKAKAEAAAAEGKVSLQQLQIEKWPEAAAAVASALSNANITMFQGAPDYAQFFTTILAQGKSILDSLGTSNFKSNGEVSSEIAEKLRELKTVATVGAGDSKSDKS